MSKDDSKLETVTFYPHSDEKTKNDSSSAASSAATGKKLSYFKWILSSWIHPGEEVEGAILGQLEIKQLPEEKGRYYQLYTGNAIGATE